MAVSVCIYETDEGYAADAWLPTDPPRWRRICERPTRDECWQQVMRMIAEPEIEYT